MSRQSNAGSTASSRVARQGTFTYPVKPGSALSTARPGSGISKDAVEEIAAASIANVVKKANVVAPADDIAADYVVNDGGAASAFGNAAYVNNEDDDDDDAEEASTSSLSKSRSESFSTDTYKKSKSKRLPSSQHQPSFLQRLVETAKVTPQQPPYTIPKSETVAAEMHSGVDEDDDEGSLSSMSRQPAVMRSLSASPTFTVKKETSEMNEDVILDRIQNLAQEKRHEFDDDDDNNDENDASRAQKANSLPTSPNHQRNPPNQERQLVPYTNIQNKQMYIPLNVARDYIGKMSGEMKSMKDNHLSIVQQIEEAYRRIEDETQNQFVIYVQV